MRKLYLSIILFTLFSCTKTEIKVEEPSSTAYEFLVNAGGKQEEVANDMFVDNDGNIFLTGVAHYPWITDDSLHFGNKILTTTGGKDAIIAKYDRFGNAVWAKLLRSSGDDIGEVIAADEQGNCYVSGTFGGKINFGNTILSPEVITNEGGLLNHFDMFLVKYDPQGKELWAKQISGPGFERPSSISIDKAGNLIVTGYFVQNVKFAETTLTTPGSSFFIAKYQNNGSLIWAKSYGNSSIGSLYASNLKLDNNENLIITGAFEGPQILGPYSLQSNGMDIFTAKLDNNGIVKWVNTFGGSSDESGRALTIDKANNIYIGGSFRNTISIGGFTINATGNSSDAFFAKILPTGTLEWIRSASGSGVEVVQDMVIQQDTLYSVGYFYQDFKIENQVINNKGRNAFITKHDLAGNLGGLTSIIINIGVPMRIHLDKSGYSTIAGYFTNSISYENMSVTSWGNFDWFLLKKKLNFK